MAVPFPAAFSKYNLDTLEEQMYLLAFMLITTGHTELVDIGWGLPWFTGKELNELQRRKAIADALLRLKSKKLVELYDDRIMQISEVHRDVLHNIDGIMMQFWTMDSEEKDYRALMVYADWLAPALIKEPDFLSPTTLVANPLATVKKNKKFKQLSS